MTLNLDKIEYDLVHEVKLSPVEAKVFLLVTMTGKMSIERIAIDLKLSPQEATNVAKRLVELGGFIDMSETEFEAMHPRFTAVNMYRKMCLRENIEFKKIS